MKNTFFSRGKNLLCTTMLTGLAALSFKADAQFLPSTVPNKVFPLPIQVEPIPTSTTGALAWPTFYNERNNGSCYSTTANFDPGTFGNENILLTTLM